MPPYGACLLGSFNLTRYVKNEDSVKDFNWSLLEHDIPYVVRAMDNVIDETTYPLKQQEGEAKSKRRMGLGITGLGNVLGFLGITYGTKEAQDWTEKLLKFLVNRMYMSSASLAAEKGPFPLFDKDKYMQGEFIKQLDEDVKQAIATVGIRNSHLSSIAPTGTISLTANNVSSGIEPVFSKSYDRTIQTFEGPMIEKVEDYAYREWGVECVTADSISVQDHVSMLTSAQKWIDSAVSKTCNVGSDVSWEEFKEVYMQAYKGGAKGCTTFRASGKRFGILNASASEDIVEEEGPKSDETVIEGGACYIDPETGIRSCE